MPLRFLGGHDDALWGFAHGSALSRAGALAVRATGHLAFGYGVHHCFGAPLARLEARIAIDALLEAFPSPTLAAPADDLTRVSSIITYGLNSLPVRLGG
jgi:cytochrome P450